MNIVIRKLTEADDERANQLLNLAFQSSTNRLNDLRFYRHLQPEGWFAACMDGNLIGTVGAISYGNVAHIGFMSVHPDFQNQGIGRKLMEHVLEWIENQSVPLVTLDASKKGYPLYEKLGFIDCDETAMFEREIMPVETGLPCGIALIKPQDLDELVPLDSSIFGADRRKVFQTLLNFYPSRAFLHRDESGKITGYVFAQMNRIGPWVMLESDQAETLLQAVLTLEYENPVSVCVPTMNQYAVEVLQAYGFEKARAGRHMAKGNCDIPGQRVKVFAQTSLGAG